MQGSGRLLNGDGTLGKESQYFYYCGSALKKFSVRDTCIEYG